jgi:hypothetical protein
MSRECHEAKESGSELSVMIQSINDKSRPCKPRKAGPHIGTSTLLQRSTGEGDQRCDACDDI